MYWRIWFELYENDRKIGSGVWYYWYMYKGNATRRAKQMFGEPRHNKRTGKTYTYKWIVSQENPWRR